MAVYDLHLLTVNVLFFYPVHNIQTKTASLRCYSDRWTHHIFHPAFVPRLAAPYCSLLTFLVLASLHYVLIFVRKILTPQRWDDQRKSLSQSLSSSSPITVVSCRINAHPNVFQLSCLMSVYFIYIFFCVCYGVYNPWASTIYHILVPGVTSVHDMSWPSLFLVTKRH